MRQTGLMVALTLVAVTGAAAEPWTFERALTQALDHNPDARLAQERIAAARAGIAQANAGVWPRLEFQSSYLRTDNPMMVFGSILNQRAYQPSLNFNDVPDVDNLNVKGMVTMPIYQGGKIAATKSAAKATAQAAEYDSAAVRNALAFEVARAFHTVLKTREFIRAADAAVQSYRTNLTVAQKRLQWGTLMKSDVLDIEVRLAQAQEDQVRARNAQSLAERALQYLLGIEEGDFAVADAAPTVSAPESGDFTRRAELAAASQREHAAEDQVRAAASGYQPRVSAFGSLDYDYGWKFDSDGGSYTAGALLQWDIWDGKLTRAKVEEARASLNAAREEKRKLRLDLGFEAKKAKLDLDAARERLRVTERAVETAAESADITRARFQEGQVLATQLMDAETALVGARVRRAEAEADQAIAIAALRKALSLPQLDTMPTTATK